MTSEATAAPLERIRTKFEQLKAAEAEHGFGVVLVDGAPLEPFPGVPEAAFDVFRIIGRIEGSHFRFAQPPELAGVAAFQAMPDNPNDPLGPALSIGQELHSVPKRLRGEIDGGEGISYDLEDGDVYHIDPDDYVFLYEHPDEDVDIHVFAPDIVTFFDEFVLGDKYPQVVDRILGPGVREQRVRKGRFQGQYEDTWLRLLAATGLAS
ncbi:hypothetical protein [Micromonospora globbae]|uniref:SMI1/KNR4 family protein n=1 Tax=Micromonospora globbae TaxID=1894969 RepID=A0A420EWI6_9ACTN|nr:hypothetical protein [Micromonospora globbae]RKF25092.1 hypothetical protein D7I43_23415 [Micromonospora globbae]WTF85673.1 hypothetical protein OH732_29135 [Micromonospora globbae]